MCPAFNLCYITEADTGDRKAIPIMGTTIVLDTPDVLEAWIAERKKRWPSKDHVMEKKKKIEEALARGQIGMSESSLLGSKRRRGDESSIDGGRVHFSAHGKTRGGARARGTDNGWRGRGCGGRASSIAKPIGRVGGYVLYPDKKNKSPTRASPASSSGSGDEIPEVASSKLPSCSADHEGFGQLSEVEKSSSEHVGDIPDQSSNPPSQRPIKLLRRAHLQHPKKLPHNSFASRPILLRNVRPVICLYWHLTDTLCAALAT